MGARSMVAVATAVLATLGLSGCSLASFVPEHQETAPAPVSLTVEISGTPGVTFEGSLGTPSATRPLRGQVPQTFTVETAVSVVVSLTKTQEDGELTARILRGGQQVAIGTTTAAYGTILLVYKVQ